MDKSVIIVIGKPNPRKKLEIQFSENPPLLYGSKMKQVTQEKYLGDQMNVGGLATSVMATIEKRKGKVIQSIFEIKSIIDSSSWIRHTEHAVLELTKLQNLFYRVILQVPSGCPTPMSNWDCAGLLMDNRILKNKLMLLHHIAKLSQESLAYKVCSVQKRLQLPGLISECQGFLEEYQIINPTE